jgi:hypothetical protein
MLALSPSALLLIWERGTSRSPLEGCLNVLAAVDPDREPKELERLSVAQCDARLLALREESLGPQVDAVVDCAACGELLELAFDTTELDRDGSPDNGPHVVHCDRGEVRFRLPSAADLTALAGEGDVASLRAALLERCILSPPANELSAAARRAVIARMAELDPLGDVELELTCPTCAAAGRAVFDVAAYFWAELDAAARDTLEDVHVLAAAYGWSEADVLGLSPERRRHYLELAG